MLARYLLAKELKLPSVTTCRNLRKSWKRFYLKDLYNRRQLVGAEPLISRWAYPNWHYPSEISALKHRIGSPEYDTKCLIQALTNPSFFERPDVLNEAFEPHPSREDMDKSKADNTEFINAGEHRMLWQLSSILRHRWPKAPEEFVQAVVQQLVDTSVLTRVAEQLGIHHLVQTAEFPPTPETTVDALKALVGALNPDRVHSFVCDFILPSISELVLEDVLPFCEPLPILEDYLKASGVQEVEPRLLHSSGVDSYMPLYVVGIFAEKELIGQSPGESLSLAVDLAAQASLLRLWDVRWNEQSFNFRDDQIPDHFEKPNHYLASVVQKDRNTSLLSLNELSVDPIDKVAIAQHYNDVIRAQVGISLERRARHKFSRGSLARGSFRFLSKPRIYTI